MEPRPPSRPPEADRSPAAELSGYVERQLAAVVPDRDTPSAARLRPAVDVGLERSLACCARISDRRYSDPSGAPTFSHLHASQYATFLYFASHAAWHLDDEDVATRLYLLNRALHSIDVLYAVELPPTFYLEHPVATVLGRASYGDHLTVYQHCTVGGSYSLEYPTIGRGVTLYAGATVIGRSTLGDGVVVGAGARIVNEDVPAGVAVTGASPDLTFRPLDPPGQLPRWFRPA